MWKRGSGAKPDTVAKSRFTSFTRLFDELEALPLVNMKNSRTFASLEKLTCTPSLFESMSIVVRAELTHSSEVAVV